MATQSPGFGGALRRLRNLLSSRDWLTPPAGRPLRPERSVFIRHVDAGSCNDSELELTALSNPIYDFERYGFRFVASPRHADVLLITGPMVRSMREPVLAAFRAMPEPRRVVTVGDGFEENDVFAGSYATVGLPAEVASAVVAHVTGDPPSPQQLLEVLLTLQTE